MENNYLTMNKTEFFDLMEQKANNYAYSIVVNADEHEDAVECIIADYMEGVSDAYKILEEQINNKIAEIGRAHV